MSLCPVPCCCHDPRWSGHAPLTCVSEERRGRRTQKLQNAYLPVAPHLVPRCCRRLHLLFLTYQYLLIHRYICRDRYSYCYWRYTAVSPFTTCVKLGKTKRTCVVSYEYRVSLRLPSGWDRTGPMILFFASDACHLALFSALITRPNKKKGSK